MKINAYEELQNVTAWVRSFMETKKMLLVQQVSLLSHVMTEHCIRRQGYMKDVAPRVGANQATSICLVDSLLQSTSELAFRGLKKSASIVLVP